MSGRWNEGKTMGGSLIGLMRHAGWFVRSTSGLVLVAFSSLTFTPAVLAAKVEYKRYSSQEHLERLAKLKRGAQDFEAFSRTLTISGATLCTEVQAADKPERIPRPRLEGMITSLRALAKDSAVSFLQTDQFLVENALSQNIRQRLKVASEAADAQANRAIRELHLAARSRSKAECNARVMRAQVAMSSDSTELAPIVRKTESLPWQSLRPTAAVPRATARQFATSGTSLMQVAKTIGVQARSQDADEYLAEDSEIVFSPAIRALAMDLRHDPIAIAGWVRNNIEFVPTFGSIQGSDLTLKLRKGNAFDISSLTIALLRVSNVSARYVRGTIDVPVQVAQNWFGNFESAYAAANILSQGGVPAVLMTEGGQPKRVRMEHVWVEAYVDYFPGRAGAKTSASDAWVPIDASFKRYEYKSLPSSTLPTFDGAAFVESIGATVQVDQTTGSVQYSDNGQAALEAMQEFTDESYTALEAEDDPKATVRSLFENGRTIVQSQSPMLPASMPFPVVARSEPFASIADSDRSYFFYRVFAPDGTISLELREPTSRVGTEGVVLSYEPASEDDAETIRAYARRNLDLAQTSLLGVAAPIPAYLIQMRPTFKFGTTKLASGQSYSLGSRLRVERGFVSPDGVEHASSGVIVVGEKQVVGFDLQGISKQQLLDSKERLANVETALANLDAEALSSVDASALRMHSTILSYFALNDAANRYVARNLAVTSYRTLSFGVINSTAEISRTFGIATGFSIRGVQLDVDQFRDLVEANNGDSKRRIAFGLTVGPRYSAMEGAILEESYSGKRFLADAVTAVEALSQAVQEGKRLVVINAQNAASALASISLPSDISNDIRSAVAAGRTAIVSNAPVSRAGWTGYGYVILDFETGSGAYRINGGLDGADCPTFEAFEDAVSSGADAIDDAVRHYGDAFLEGLATLAQMALDVMEQFLALGAKIANGGRAIAAAFGSVIGAISLVLQSFEVALKCDGTTLFQFIATSIVMLSMTAILLASITNPITAFFVGTSITLLSGAAMRQGLEQQC